MGTHSDNLEIVHTSVQSPAGQASDLIPGGSAELQLRFTIRLSESFFDQIKNNPAWWIISSFVVGEEAQPQATELKWQIPMVAANQWGRHFWLNQTVQSARDVGAWGGESTPHYFRPCCIIRRYLASRVVPPGDSEWAVGDKHWFYVE